MGAVYRTRDTKLNRDVALKVLQPAVASDRERFARFRREAQVLASLNDPHIVAIYGLEESNSAIVMTPDYAVAVQQTFLLNFFDELHPRTGRRPTP